MALASKSWVAGFVAFPSSPLKSRTACKRPGVGNACKRPDGIGGPLRFKEAGDFLHCESQGEVPWAWVDGELSEFQATRPRSLTRYIDRKNRSDLEALRWPIVRSWGPCHSTYIGVKYPQANPFRTPLIGVKELHL